MCRASRRPTWHRIGGPRISAPSIALTSRRTTPSFKRVPLLHYLGFDMQPQGPAARPQSVSGCPCDCLASRWQAHNQHSHMNGGTCACHGLFSANLQMSLNVSHGSAWTVWPHLRRLLDSFHGPTVQPETEQEAASAPEEEPASSTTLPVYVMLPLDTVWLVERDGKRVRRCACMFCCS